MGTVLAAVALSLLALLGLIAAVLFVPVDYVVSAGTGRGFRMRVRWLFGLVRVTAPRRRERPAREPQPKARARRRAARRAGRGGKARGGRHGRSWRTGRAARRILAVEGLGGRVVRLLRDLLRALGLRRARVGLRVGTGDPAETGWVCAVAGPLLVLLPRTRAVRVDFQPEFDEAALDLVADGAGSLVPARIVGALGRFALSRQGLRVIQAVVWDRRR